MTKLERLNKMYRHLVSLQQVSTQAQLSQIIQRNKSSVNCAFKGDERYLTINFLHTINRRFGYIFNETWIETGNGNFLKQENKNLTYSQLDLQQLIELLKDKDEQINKLINLLENK